MNKAEFFEVFKKETVRAGKLIDNMDELLVKLFENSDSDEEKQNKRMAIHLSGILIEINKIYEEIYQSCKKLNELIKDGEENKTPVETKKDQVLPFFNFGEYP
ncbi:MAG: hypothetical protein AAB475_00985 [Patescibacteria group bacterium]